MTTARAAELEQLRADAARERDELRELLDDRARVLTEARDGERSCAERDLDAVRAELARLRQEPERAEASAERRRRRGKSQPAAESSQAQAE